MHCSGLALYVVLFFACAVAATTALTLGIVHAQDGNLDPSLPQALNASAPGVFTLIDSTDATSTTPDLSWLSQFDVLLIFGNNDFANQTLLGDLVAQYVDNGGGVVTATYTVASCCYGSILTGQFQTKYQAIALNETCYGKLGSTVYLGETLYSSHPLVERLVNLTDSSNDRPECMTLAEDAYAVATWSDGSFLIAVRDDLGPKKVNRVDIGFYPLNHEDNADAMNLLADALVYTVNTTPSAGSRLELPRIITAAVQLVNGVLAD